MAGRLFLSAALLSTAAFAAPLEERQACASQGQCGGQGWSGPTCCPSGTTCQLQNAWYSQCLPGAAPPPAVTTTRPATTAASSTRPATTSSTRSTTVVNPPTTTVAPPPGTTVAPPPGTTVAPPPGGATYTGNPFAGVNQWANAYYRSEVSSLAVPSLSGRHHHSPGHHRCLFHPSEVSSLAVPSLSGPLATAAAKVADVPTFQWMDTTAKVPLIDGALADIRRANAAGGNYAGIFVVYNLPDRDCAAAASNVRRDTTAKVPLIDGALADIRRANAAGGNYAGIFVVYNLPDRDCAAAASNGHRTEYVVDWVVKF
ncbi:hypothetical protein BN1723_010077 [Verticillium longisporum]|uniref:CBM1 domain-containing protein n=1 Tax=Verticillium longisporum TaxID=100787 RepID=A0A0G4KUW1_VERLO|nr:hypothetical protein BN1723_010077 [Verticillium longisporum]